MILTLVLSTFNFQKYKVDLALWGHHHSYQRSCQVYKEKCTPGAPIHVVIGMAGQGLSHNLRYVTIAAIVIRIIMYCVLLLISPD